MSILKFLTGQPLRAFRSAVAKLKKAGLVSKSVDARKQAPTRYMRGQVKKFQDVLDGKATVVKAPSRAEAKELSDTFRVKGRRVVVPVEPPPPTPSTEVPQYKRGSRKSAAVPQYNRATHRVEGPVQTMYGYDVRRVHTRKAHAWGDIPRPPKGQRYIYRLPTFSYGGQLAYIQYEELDDLEHFVESNRQGSYKNYKNVPSYVEVYHIVGGEQFDIDNADDEDF